jgi:hypothetical protein
MAWANPRTWSVGEIVTAAIQNTHIRDLFRYLKGLDGVPTIESGLVIDNTDGDEYLKLPLLSTAECASVLGAEAKMAFDEQTHDIKWHNGSAVVSAKDLATAFIASQAAGDLPYASSASAWTRLAKGSNGDVLTLAAGVPAWSSTFDHPFIQASDVLKNSNNTSKTTTSATYVKIKEILINEAMAGTVRVKFDLRTNEAFTPVTAYAKIYVNDVAVGTEQTDVTGSYATKSQDLPVTWVKGTLVQIYAHANGTAAVSDVCNFRFYYDFVKSVTNQDP